MLNGKFSGCAKNANVNVDPYYLHKQIDKLTHSISNLDGGFHNCGFAKSQAAYEETCSKLFERLDGWQVQLSFSKYLLGDSL